MGKKYGGLTSVRVWLGDTSAESLMDAHGKDHDDPAASRTRSNRGDPLGRKRPPLSRPCGYYRPRRWLMLIAGNRHHLIHLLTR